MDMNKLGELLKDKRVWIVGGVLVGGLWLLTRRKSSGDVQTVPYAQDALTAGDNGGGGSSSGEGSSLPTGNFVSKDELLNTVNAIASAYQRSLADQNARLEAMHLQQEQFQNDTRLATGGTGVFMPSMYGNPGLTLENIPSSPGVYDVGLAVSDPSPSTSSGAKYYGVGGIDYNKASAADKQKIEANEKRIQTDPAYRQSEIARAERAIADRRADGEDISEQVAYLNKLKKAG